MKEFLENLPVNHWVSYGLFSITCLAMVYSLYFYFSKEGKDERGRGVFAKASMVTFVVTILVFIFYSVNLDLFEMSLRPVSFIILIGIMLITITQAFGILIFNKLS